MKILLAIKTLESAGGAERVLVDIANGLASRGHNVIILSYDGDKANSFYPLNSEVSWRCLGLGRTGCRAGITETLSRMFSLRREIVALNPSVAVGFMTSMYIPLGLALMGTGIPVIASEHTTRERYVTRKVERFMLNIMPWLAQSITVVSQDIKDSHPLGLRRSMIVIPNPFRLTVIRRADISGEGKSRKILLSVGRLIESKDYATLIDAFSKISEKVPEWDLRILGDGNLRGELLDQIAKLQLGNRIFLPGTTKNISAEYESAQLFCLPSRYESLGLVVLEALAHGLPVVGFADCSGVNRIIQPEYNGVLVVGANRSEKLAETLLSLITSVGNRKRLVPERFEMPVEFTPERVVDNWERMLIKSMSSTHDKQRRWVDFREWGRRLVKVENVWFDDDILSLKTDIIRIRQRSSLPMGVQGEIFYTLAVDLNRDENALWASLNKNVQYEVRRAERENICVSFDQQKIAESIANFKAAYEELSQRNSIAKLNETNLDKLIASGSLVLSVARSADGKNCSWHSYILNNNRLRLLHSVTETAQDDASAQRAFIGRANRFHHWRDMLYFRDKGFLIYDFGGWYPGTEDKTKLGINGFKEGFGGKIEKSYNAELACSILGSIALFGCRMKKYLDGIKGSIITSILLKRDKTDVSV